MSPESLDVDVAQCILDTVKIDSSSSNISDILETRKSHTLYTRIAPEVEVVNISQHQLYLIGRNKNNHINFVKPNLNPQYSKTLSIDLFAKEPVIVSTPDGRLYANINLTTKVSPSNFKNLLYSMIFPEENKKDSGKKPQAQNQ